MFNDHRAAHTNTTRRIGTGRVVAWIAPTKAGGAAQAEVGGGGEIEGRQREYEVSVGFHNPKQ